MTRFKWEISGSLGAFWKKNAEEEVRKAVAQADEKATVDEDGAIRRNSNGRYLMDDFCGKLEYAGYPFIRETIAEKRKVQDAESLAKYRRIIPQIFRCSIDKDKPKEVYLAMS